jgi:hypothetical protein
MQAMKAYGSGGIAPLILNLGTKWRRVVTSRPGLYKFNEEGKGKVSPCARHEGVWKWRCSSINS